MLSNAASESMRMGNWELARGWRTSFDELASTLERARKALKQRNRETRSEAEPDLH
jgi:hypothetical protein